MAALAVGPSSPDYADASYRALHGACGCPDPYAEDVPTHRSIRLVLRHFPTFAAASGTRVRGGWSGREYHVTIDGTAIVRIGPPPGRFVSLCGGPPDAHMYDRALAVAVALQTEGGERHFLGEANVIVGGGYFSPAAFLRGGYPRLVDPRTGELA